MAFMKNLFNAGKVTIGRSKASLGVKAPFKEPKKHHLFTQMEVSINAMCHLPQLSALLFSYRHITDDNIGIKLLSDSNGQVIWSQALDWVKTMPRDSRGTQPYGMGHLKLAPNGEWFVGAGVHSAEIRSTKTGELIKDLHDSRWESCSSAGVSADGQLIAVAVRLMQNSTFNQVFIFNPDGECLPVEIKNPLFIHSIDYCPVSHDLAIGDSNGQITIVDAETGTQRQSWKAEVKKYEVNRGAYIIGGTSNSIRLVSYSRSGRLLAVALNNGQVELWEPSTGNRIITLPGHAGTTSPNVSSLIWCGHDDYLLTSGEDGTLRLWDGENGALLWAIASNPPFYWDHPALLTDTGILFEAGNVGKMGVNGAIRYWKTGFENG